MRLKPIAKAGQKILRQARVKFLACARELGWMRERLYLPRNDVCSLEHSADPSVKVIVVAPPQDFDRVLPFMPGEIEPHETFLKEKRGQFPASLVAEIKGGRFWGFYGGSVFTGDGRLVPELSKDVWGIQLHSAFARAHLPRPKPLPGLTLSLVTPEAAGNYHHWTVDLLPRAGLVEKAGYRLGDFDQVLIKERGSPFQKEAYRRLGLDEKKLINVDDHFHVQAERLVVASVRMDNSRVSLADMEFSRRLYLPDSAVPAKPTRRLYVGRHDAAFRRVLNRPELLAMLTAHGFEEVAMSSMSVADQAKIFSEAEIVVGPNGSALANLIFAHPECRVIEFFAPGWVVGYNWMICTNFGLAYTAIVGAGQRPPPGALPRDVKQDIMIDVDMVRSVLENPPVFLK